MTVHPPKAGELELIRWIRHQKQMPREVIVGPGDDAAGLLLPPNELCVVTVDSVVDGIHFVSAEIEPEQIGRKAAARALSDIAAMAAHPVGIVAATNIPRDTGMDYAKAVIKGQIDFCEAARVAVMGGDIAIVDGPLTVTVTAIGAVKPDKIALRSGAKRGDLLCVTGELGGAHLGRHLTFNPRLEEARWISAHCKLHAMIDISDGLACDANHLAKESHAGVRIDPVTLPISPAAHEAARHSGKTAVEHALYDGEDYELLFCLPRRSAKALFGRPDPPVRIAVIGEVIEEPGLWMKTEHEGRAPLDPEGWEHRFADGGRRGHTA